MKYIFIDSNIYRNIFASEESFSQDITDLIIKLINNDETKLLLPSQVKDEVERNRFNKWFNQEKSGLKSKITNLEQSLEKFKKGYSKYSGAEKIEKAIKNEIKQLKREEENIPKKFLDKKSKSNQHLKTIFGHAELVNETEKILKNAQNRKNKGNPPNDKENSFGDCIIWESLLSFFQKNKKSELLFISNDKKAWGDDQINPWLLDEWHGIVGNRKITLVYNISEIPSLTKPEREKIEIMEKEEQKKELIASFVNSGSWNRAGLNAQNLRLVASLLNFDEILEVIKACIENYEIHQSFSAHEKVKNLLFDLKKGDLDKIDDNLWNEFCRKMSFDDFSRNKTATDPDDLPF